MASTKCVNKKLGISLLIIGSFFFVLSIIVLACFPTIYQNILRKDITLTEGSVIFDFWRNIPLPIFERLYFFNITNAEDFLKNGAKMDVNQIGPYTYEGKWEKENIDWHPNGTVTFQERRTYQFRRDLSVGNQDDEIYTLNGPLATVGNIVKDYNKWAKAAVSVFLILNDEKIIIKKSIRELVYDGYEDKLIKYGRFLKPDLPFKDGVFSWLYGKNDTYDGTFTVFTGENDITKLNVINNWNGEEKLNFWNGSTCNMINGSNAEFSPPLEEDQQEYTFFQSIFCRSLTFQYTSDVSNHGITARRFEVTKKAFGDETVNSENACFDSDPELLSGVQDVSICQFGAPVVLSFPHFYLADTSYLKAIDGLDNFTSYPSLVEVEPLTGTSLQMTIRFQINLMIRKIPDLFPFYETPPGLYPVFWAEIDVSLTDEMAHTLRNQLETPKIITYTLLGIILALSVLAIILGIVIMIKVKKQSSDMEDDPLICPHDNSQKYGISHQSEKKEKVTNPSMPNSTASIQHSGRDFVQSPCSDDDADLLDSNKAPQESGKK